MTERTESAIEPEIGDWLSRIGLRRASVLRLAGDVSARRYYRVTLPGGGSRVLARYPPELRDAQRRFGRAAELLERVGVRVPHRFEEDVERGFALLEDVGERTLAEREDLGVGAMEAWVDRAYEIGVRIAGLPAHEVAALGSPPLDRGLLEQELARTIEVVLAPRGLAPRPFEAALSELCGLLASDPPVPCHRDFMARNLVPLEGGELAVLDFQDLRLGPPAYDTASLLNDTFFAPAGLERRLLARLAARGVGAEAYRRAVAQRTLKAAGTFVSFALRGDARHLGLVPRCLDRAVRSLLELPETEAAVAPLAERLRAIGARGLC